MSSYTDLMQVLEMQREKSGGKYAGLNTALDIQQAFKDATNKYKMESQLKQQESTSDAAKGIAQAGLMSGVTPNVDTAIQQYNKATGSNLATGQTSQPTSQPTTPVNSDLPAGQTQLYGFKGVQQQQKNQAEQDKLEQNYSTRLDKEFQSRGNLGALKSKVNQAGQLRALLDQGYNPTTKTYDIKGSQYSDLLIGMSNLASQAGVASDAKMEALRQKTLQGDVNAGIGYFTGVPQAATTTPNFQFLADSINREGITAEAQLDRSMQQLIARFPTNLKKDTQQRIAKSVVGGGYTDLFKLSPAYNDESQKLTNLLSKLKTFTTPDKENSTAVQDSSVNVDQSKTKDPLGLR